MDVHCCSPRARVILAASKGCPPRTRAFDAHLPGGKPIPHGSTNPYAESQPRKGWPSRVTWSLSNIALSKDTTPPRKWALSNDKSAPSKPSSCERHLAAAERRHVK